MTAAARRPTPYIDQQRALRTSAANLAREFDGSYPPGTIERLLISCYDDIAARAAIINYLPLLAERAARHHLHTLANVELFGAGADSGTFFAHVSPIEGGFQKFCAGETDISDASRPIKDEEKAAGPPAHSAETWIRRFMHRTSGSGH